MHHRRFRAGPTLALAAFLGLLAPATALPAFAQEDPPPPEGEPGGEKDKQPKTPPAETKEQIARAKELEKKLDGKNKLDAGKAIEALGAMHTKTASKALMDFAHRTSNSEYGAAAVRALGWEGNKDAVDFLCGPDGARSGRLLVAEAACEALARVGDRAAIPTLLELIKSGKSVIAAAAIGAVVHLDPKADGLANLLVAKVGDSDDRVRMSVADALGALESPKALDGLLQMAAKDSNSLVRERACRSLARTKDPAKARPVLEEIAAKDKSQEVRGAAEDALRHFPPAAPAQGGGGKK
jgi:HEAT repeat protein